MGPILLDLTEYDSKENDLLNKIKKNYKKYKKVYKKKNTDCFRIYDKDIPSFPLTVDYYAGNFLVNYYWTSNSTEEENSYHKFTIVETLTKLFNIDAEKIYHKDRKTREEKEQFDKFDDQKDIFTGMENGMLFYINLTDYLDTGLFLDHRSAREIAASSCKEKTVLNLFAYTSSFSIYVLGNGAKFCKSVDISNTYCEWSIKNHELNSFSEDKYEIKRDDCVEYLKYAVKKGEKYDYIIMDPPTLSRAKKMKKSFFQIQKDHVELIENAMKLLNDGGVLFFSNNLTTFKMSDTIMENFNVKDISDKTIPEGFRNKKIHKSYLITRR
ncbi:MAG: class I SAM-dependent methyltransferase [Candidatus Delongbacteria bacterium]|nr:class I SAM-dependent methyltransferase [Candidatus Delongbacteria bacterium]MBN2835051.1 class I SAM-dependent methyltransferase [Candidatus Delongbacteria bacterium]